MNYRIQHTGVIVVIGLFLLVVGIFLYTTSISTEPHTGNEDATVEYTSTHEPAPDAKRITAQYQYESGVHRMAGVVQVPTPCDEVVVDPLFTEEGRVVELLFSVAPRNQEQMCATVVADAPFTISFSAERDIEMRAFWEGEAVHLNLLPVTKEGDLNTFFDIKG